MRTIFPCWDNGVKSYTKGGRVQCDVCGSFMGVRARNYWRKLPNGDTQIKLFSRCANCNSLEVRDNRSGDILKQDKTKVLLTTNQ